MLDLMMSESCGEKWYEPSFLNWEEPQGLLVQISFRDLSSLEIRMFLSSGYKEGPSYWRVLLPASGEGQKLLPAHVISQIHSA